MVYVCARVEQC